MLKRLALTVVAGAFFVLIARADTVNINSSATETTNSSGSPTQNISPNSAWAGPFAGSSWVSNANTGSTSNPGFIVVPNGTAVTFTDTFTLAGPATSAWLDVLADDTASVVVNGATLFAANLGGSYPLCSSKEIGCLSNTAGMFTSSQLDPLLKSGLNTIAFTVYQENESSFGLDYSGSITSGSVNTPEPGSLVLLGVGLAGLALIGRRALSA
jgi:hypothetical protein